MKHKDESEQNKKEYLKKPYKFHKTKLSDDFKITIPNEIIQSFKILPGDELEIQAINGIIRMTPFKPKKPVFNSLFEMLLKCPVKGLDLTRSSTENQLVSELREIDFMSEEYNFDKGEPAKFYRESLTSKNHLSKFDIPEGRVYISEEAREKNHRISPNRIPTHPGEILNNEFLQPAKVNLAEFAKHPQVQLQDIEDIVTKKRGVNADLAWRLSQGLGTTPEFWMNAQLNYDLALNKPLNTIPRVELDSL